MMEYTTPSITPGGTHISRVALVRKGLVLQQCIFCFEKDAIFFAVKTTTSTRIRFVFFHFESQNHEGWEDL